MRKRLLAVVMFSCLVVLAACSGGAVQDDIMNYINDDLSEARDLETKAVAAYEGVSGANYTDDATMYTALTDVVIPNYSKLIDELNSVSIETDELKKIHKIYVSGAEKQFNAFEIIIEAIEKQDSSMIEEANQLLEEGRLQIEEYNNKLDALAEDNNVEIEEK